MTAIIRNAPLPLAGGGAGVGVCGAHPTSRVLYKFSPHPLTPSPSRGGESGALMKFTLSWLALNPLPLRGFGVVPRSGSDCTAIATPKGRGWGEAPAFQNLHLNTRKFPNTAHHPAPKPPPLEGRGSAVALIGITQ